MDEPPKLNSEKSLWYLKITLSIKNVLAPFFLSLRFVDEISLVIDFLCFNKKTEATNLSSLS